MIQAPIMNPYAVQQVPPVGASYNAVKIDVHNPAMNAPGSGVAQPQYYPQYASTYAPVTAPMYNYPQAPVYNYPPAQTYPQYPAYIAPQVVQAPQVPVRTIALDDETLNTLTAASAASQAAAAAQAAQAAAQAAAAAPVVPTVVPQVVQQNYNAPGVPQPVVTQPQVVVTAPQAATVAQTVVPPQTPEIVAPDAQMPQAPAANKLDLNAFLARLNDPDFEVQANVMEEIANMVKDNPAAATEMLDEKVINSLTTIVGKDSTTLAGPTPEQITVRQKMMNNKTLTEAEQKLAMTITPMEQAERNKSYAMFTMAILQKLYSDEIAKMTGNTVPLTELPGAVTIVENLKNNDNPMVRTSAIEALSYIQNPAYKQDLTTLFTVAQNDTDRGVKDAAKTALGKLG